MANMYDIVIIGGLLLPQWPAAIHIRYRASDRYLEGLEKNRQPQNHAAAGLSESNRR